jgi:peptide/nickel transport system permease protein
MAVPILLLISFCVFLLVHIAPGDAARALLGSRAVSPEALEAIRAKYNLNDPFMVQYGKWLWQVLHGDLGRSIQSQQQVITAITQRLGLTFSLTAYGTIIVLVIGIPLGALSAFRQGSRFDRVVVMLGVFGVSAPAFATGIFLLYVFGVVLGLFPTFGPGYGFVGRVWHLTLPAIALSLSVLAIVIKITRASMIEELDKDYVAFARARGLSHHRITYIYLLRNALIPVVTAASLIVVGITAGAIYVEVTFALPGLGRLLVDSVRQRDLPLVQGATLFFSVFVIGVNLITDVIYTLIDPRIHFGRMSN